MIFQKTTFSRVFPSALTGGLIPYTNFGFESEGKRFFDVKIYGKPRIEQGMKVVALLEKKDSWDGNGLLGWVDCYDGKIVCESPAYNFLYFFIFSVQAIALSARAYKIYENPQSAEIAVLIVVVTIGGGAMMFLYNFFKFIMVKNSLKSIRDEITLEISR